MKVAIGQLQGADLQVQNFADICRLQEVLLQNVCRILQLPGGTGIGFWSKAAARAVVSIDGVISRAPQQWDFYKQIRILNPQTLLMWITPTTSASVERSFSLADNMAIKYRHGLPHDTRKPTNVLFNQWRCGGKFCLCSPCHPSKTCNST